MSFVIARSLVLCAKLSTFDGSVRPNLIIVLKSLQNVVKIVKIGFLQVLSDGGDLVPNFVLGRK